MKNKYQEAIDFFTIGRIFTEEEAEDMYEMRYRLGELIDKLPYWLELEEKEKPMKPIEYDNAYKHCSDCGQKLSGDNHEGVNNKAIDWSGKE